MLPEGEIFFRYNYSSQPLRNAAPTPQFPVMQRPKKTPSDYNGRGNKTV
jgi:hypothetical protein